MFFIDHINWGPQWKCTLIVKQPLIRIVFVKSKIVLTALTFIFSILADTLITSDAIHSFSCRYSHT